MSLMMGDTPTGVVARRNCPSRVGHLPHAPADPRALYRRYCGQQLHVSWAAPGSPKVGSRMVRVGCLFQGGLGRGWRVPSVVDVPVIRDKLLQSKSYVNVEVPPDPVHRHSAGQSSCASQRQAPTVFQVQFLEVVDHARCRATTGCTQLQRVDKVAFPVVAQRQIPMVPSV